MGNIFKNKNIYIIILALVLVVGAVVSAYQLGKNSNKLRDGEVIYPFEDIYEFSEELTGKEKSDSISEINKYLDDMRSKNIYMQVNHTQEGFQTVILNNKGQGVVQDSETGSIEVFRGDNHSILYTDHVSLVHDITVLELLKYSVEAVNEGYAKIYKDKTDDDEGNIIDGFKVRYVDIVGHNDIHKLYSNVNNDFANTFIENLKEGTDNADFVALRFIFLTDTTGENNFAAGCNVIIDNEEYMSWNFENYVELYDWELGQEWFDYDYENPSDDDALESMLEKLIRELDDMLHTFAQENNIDNISEQIENDNGEEIDIDEDIVGTDEEIEDINEDEDNTNE